MFQVRGIQETAAGNFEPVILSHIGRALTPEQQEDDGKWHLYAGFYKTLALYNIDHVLLDKQAREQAEDTGNILVVEGCFDVAKLVEAGIHNVVATFGANFSEQQGEQLEFIRKQTGINHFLFWYDRDKAGAEGQKKALEILENHPSLRTSVFDWTMEFSSDVRPRIPIPASLTDVCEFSVEQLRWLGDEGVI